jgi:hypothetical protein
MNKITTNQIEWCDLTIIQHEKIITNHLYKPTKKQQLQNRQWENKLNLHKNKPTFQLNMIWNKKKKRIEKKDNALNKR